VIASIDCSRELNSTTGTMGSGTREAGVVVSLIERSKSLLRSHRISPKKALGQSFMIEPSMFSHMAEYASLDHSDTVLDIGAGLGFLTRFLAERCRMVLGVETDPELVNVLREEMSDVPNVKVIQGNVFKVGLPRFNKVVAIPPYYISSQLLLWLFGKHVDVAVLILQREFAYRLKASIGSDNYGWLAVLTHYFAEVEVLEDVPKSMFYPQPAIDSIIVRLKPRKSYPFTVKDETAFRQIVQSFFTRRNRKVRNRVLSYLEDVCGLSKEVARNVAEEIPFRDKRVRDLAPEDFGVLTNVLCK